uniref:Putative tick til 16 n=1 Tax=Hyalomma excavatum TaxID=257692 RepID=A0A131XHF1_9ACAR
MRKMLTVSCLFMVLAIAIAFTARAAGNPSENPSATGAGEASSVPKAVPVCGPNERYKTCRSSTCGERSCKTRFSLFRKCTTDCVSRCFCRRRYYRNYDGRCVRLWKCGKWIASFKEKLQEVFKGSRAE